MSEWKTELPSILKGLHELSFEFDEGFDFEPYNKFLSADENSLWFKAWTGNPEADGAQFRFFGQDGSEGEKGVVAVNLGEYLWLLAGGRGPYEAVAYGGEGGTRNAQFTSFAEANSDVRVLQPSEVLANARAKYTEFAEYIDSFCR